MSDKRFQYARVEIVENTLARVVVHWRYALSDNWGRSDPLIELNNTPLSSNKEYHFGHNMSLEGTDLLIWVESESTKPIRLLISPK